MSHSHLEGELDKLKACIHCGMCLSACPTYRVTGSEAESPRGRLYLMKKLLEGQLDDAAVAPHLDQCLACHGCETVCPSGVRYGQVLMATREDLATRRPAWQRVLKRLAFRRILPNRRLLQAGGWLLRVYQSTPLQRWVRQSGLFRLFPGLGYQESLLPRLPKRRALHAGLSFGNPQNEHVALLLGCVMDVFYNPVHWATIEVLVANGYYVSIPRQTCCGALAHHAGETDITRHLARQNIRRILRSNPRWIVVNSAGCGSTMQEYGHLLAGDPVYGPKAAQFAAQVIDVMALLSRKPLAPLRQPVPQTLTYHAACHLYHVQKVTTEPVGLLSQIPGLTLVPLTDFEACCGSAGIYNVEHPDLSMEVLARKMTHVQAAQAQGADTLVTGNPGCLLQLEKGIRQAGLPMRVCHPVEILAEAYRREAPP